MTDVKFDFWKFCKEREAGVIAILTLLLIFIQIQANIASNYSNYVQELTSRPFIEIQNPKISFVPDKGIIFFYNIQNFGNTPAKVVEITLTRGNDQNRIYFQNKNQQIIAQNNYFQFFDQDVSLTIVSSYRLIVKYTDLTGDNNYFTSTTFECGKNSKLLPINYAVEEIAEDYHCIPSSSSAT